MAGRGPHRVRHWATPLHCSNEHLNIRMPVMSTETKTALLAQFARVAKALGSPARLELLDLLTQADRSVDELARAAGCRWAYCAGTGRTGHRPLPSCRRLRSARS